MSTFNPLHSFTVSTTREVEKTESHEENGATVTRTVKVKEPVDTLFAFKKPSRIERETSEEYRTKLWHDYVAKGLMSFAVAQLTYANAGGVATETERVRYTALKTEYSLKLMAYQLAVVQKETEKAAALMGDLNRIRDEYIRMEEAQNSFYNNTADAKAKVKMTEWLLLNLSYSRASVDAPWEPYFKGADLAAKLDHMDTLEESGDEVYAKARSELMTVASIATLFIMGGGVLTKESVEAFVKDVAGDGNTVAL